MSPEDRDEWRVILAPRGTSGAAWLDTDGDVLVVQANGSLTYGDVFCPFTSMAGAASYYAPFRLLATGLSDEACQRISAHTWHFRDPRPLAAFKAARVAAALAEAEPAARAAGSDLRWRRRASRLAAALAQVSRLARLSQES